MSHSRQGKEFIPFPISQASAESLQRLKDLVSDEELEKPEIEPMVDVDSELRAVDPSFQSELDYEGYLTLEESDNDAYNSLEAERTDYPEDEIKIKERAGPEGLETGEEDLVDPQENRK